MHAAHRHIRLTACRSTALYCTNHMHTACSCIIHTNAGHAMPHTAIVIYEPGILKIDLRVTNIFSRKIISKFRNAGDDAKIMEPCMFRNLEIIFSKKYVSPQGRFLGFLAHISVYFAVCCPRSTPSVVWIWRKDKLPLCFLIVLCVCSTNPHIRKCCTFSRDMAGQIRLPGSACADFTHRAGGLRITAFEKVLLQSFPSIEGLSMLQFQKPKRTSMEVPSHPRSQMTKQNSLKRPAACLLAAQSWDLAAGSAIHIIAGAWAAGGESR